MKFKSKKGALEWDQIAMAVIVMLVVVVVIWTFIGFFTGGRSNFEEILKGCESIPGNKCFPDLTECPSGWDRVGEKVEKVEGTPVTEEGSAPAEAPKDANTEKVAEKGAKVTKYICNDDETIPCCKQSFTSFSLN